MAATTSLTVVAQNIYSESKWEERDKWQQVEKIIRLLKLEEGSKVADIGSHQGYMTVKLAAEVGAAGTVYAVDVSDYQLDNLRTNLADRDITNVEVIKGDYDDPHLPENALNAVLILDTYHEIDDYMTVLGHIKEALKVGGLLIIAEPVSEERRGLPREEQTARHEIDYKWVEGELIEAGYEIKYSQDPFIDRTEPKGDKLWAVVAAKEG
ncbi:MAG: class I SAM-dependent methyltransferase [Cyclobacteriaceae bacterium]